MTSPILVIPPRDTGGRGPPAAASSPASVDRLESGGWEEAQPDRVLATVLFSDIAGASETAPSLGDRAWRELLERHHELLRRQPVRFRRKKLDTAGDGFLATFDGPARAIRCGCAIVDSVPELGLRVRVGLHTGECELIEGKVAGIAVHGSEGGRERATRGGARL